MEPQKYCSVLLFVYAVTTACHADHRIGQSMAVAKAPELPAKTSAAPKTPYLKKTAYPTCLTDVRADLRTEVAGIDVSHWDGRINWQEVSSEGIRFVYIKATEGLSFKDPSFDSNWEGVGKTSMYKGAYHYFLPGLTTARQVTQAQNFIKAVRDLKEGDLPPMIDFEDDPAITAEALQARLFAFIREIEACFRVRPLIYTSKALYSKYLSWHNSFADYEVWIADYSYERPELCDKKNMRIWQFTDRAKVKGISQYVDMDIFYTTSEDLKKLIIKNK
ncbi:MAG TPA: GH25 family lysozyme [Puia sp.]|nr:GH25 family lysozyme [Puia sp.]